MSPPNTVLNEDVQEAVMRLLSSLPADTAMRFFWKDGRPHFGLQLGSGAEQVLSLARNTDTNGALPAPSSIH